MSFADTIPAVVAPTGSPTFVGPTAPPLPTKGNLWLDTSATPNVLKVYNNTSWVVASSGGSGGGASMPSASAQNQILVSGVGPGFTWAPGDLDEGRY